jgi:hypothetical protein
MASADRGKTIGALGSALLVVAQACSWNVSLTPAF